MPELFVAAYVDGEAERTIARAALRQPVDHPAFVEGWIGEDRIESLTNYGIAVVVLRSVETGPAVLSSVQTGHVAVARPSKRHDTALRDVIARLESTVRLVKFERLTLGTSNEDVYRVSLRGTLTAEARASLRDRRIVFLSFRGGLYQTFLTLGQQVWLRDQPFVESIRRYDLTDSLHTALVSLMQKGLSAEPRLYDLVLHRPRDAARMFGLVQRLIGHDTIVDASEHAIRFRASIPDPVLAFLARLPWVLTIMPVAPATLSCDVARPLIGLPAPANAAGFPWDGTGELVAVIDSGIDRNHPDLKDQLAAEPVSFDGAPVDDRVGHGTHIAGIIAGTGAAARAGGGTPICGIAPGAKLIVVANVELVESKAVPNIPVDVEPLFDLAVGRGASILNVSWGRGPTIAVYDETAASIDRYVRKHPDVLVVVAAGNYGVAPDGDYDFYTLSTAATAKNGLSVGASATSRTGFAETWGARSNTAFPRPAAHDERISGDPDRVAGISSRGPTEFQSAKPDLVAPGTHILAPRAKTIDPTLLWSNHTTPDYVYFGGTSMAAPVAAGAAAIVRQYLRTERHVAKPSAALLKAVLISGASRLPTHRDAATAKDIGFPDLDQGFGRIDLTRLLPSADAVAPHPLLAFRDVPNADPGALVSGTAHAYSILVREATGPLVVTLAWTDIHGKNVQNSLTLSVKPLATGKPIIGNATFVHMRPKLKGASALDDRNTVHQVRIENAPPGEYVIHVTAQELLEQQQGYALVAFGDLRQAELRPLKSI